MTDDDFGRAEYKERLSDLAAVKAGTMTLEQAQDRARRRRISCGLSASQAARFVHDAAVDRRKRALAGKDAP